MTERNPEHPEHNNGIRVSKRKRPSEEAGAPQKDRRLSYNSFPPLLYREGLNTIGGYMC